MQKNPKRIFTIKIDGKKDTADILVSLLCNESKPDSGVNSHTPPRHDRLSALTHRMSVRAWILAHWRRWGLHPGWRHAIRVGGHRRASHARHWGREAVRSSGHAVEASVLGWSRIHPRRPVMLHITYTFRFKSRLFPSQGNESSILAADHRWLVTVSSRSPRCPALVDGMSSRGGDWSLSQFGHE